MTGVWKTSAFVIHQPASLSYLNFSTFLYQTVFRRFAFFAYKVYYLCLKAGRNARINNNDSELIKFAKDGFNADQSRDERGRWSVEGASEHSHILEIAYNGRYHDLLVRELAKGMRARGGIVIERFKVTAYNGMTAVADAIVKNQLGQLYILEVKTGQDPTFRYKQSFVYPYICFGNHAVSSQSNITAVGLVPGQPLPKMPVIIYESLKPGFENAKGDICGLYK